MNTEHCFSFLCFVPLDASAPKFFGFSEFLASLALMVLAWTIADVRYRFRVRTAPLPLQGLTFFLISSIGLLTLLTDLWRAEQWLVPQGNIISSSGWQAILGGLFLLTFLSWAWFAFIRPPRFSKRNAERYAQTLYRFILKGSPVELSIVADELSRSAKSLVQNATDRGTLKNNKKDTPLVSAYANDILLLIADKRFCRAIVETSPGTALAFFQEISKTKKYGIQVSIFSKNLVTIALSNKDSFLFHEAEVYESGLIGHQKPLSHAMFSNYKMVEAIGTLLDPDIWEKRKWDSDQWEAYCRVVLLVFRDYVDKEFWSHSSVLYRAIGYIEHAVDDLYKLNETTTSAWDDDTLSALRVVMNFIEQAIEILEEKGPKKDIKLRNRERNGIGTFYDHLASMVFEIIFAASAVRSPVDQCWWIQHNSVWSKIFDFGTLDGPAAKIVKFKVRRLLYDEICEMKKFPNFKSARILGFCLNVLGLSLREKDYNSDSKALHKVVLSWTKKNYAWLHSYNPRVAEACLVDGLTYDVENARIVKTYPVEGLRREPHYVYLDVEKSVSNENPENGIEQSNQQENA